MKIAHIQRDIEESLANLATATLPAALEGLRHLPVADRNPQVSIRNLNGGRKVRDDAAASYFDPERCEVVIRFFPFETPNDEGDRRETSAPDSDGQSDTFDFEAALSQSAVRRREREGDIPGADADRILKQIEEDAAAFLLQPSTSAIMEEAARLIDRHPLRTYDTLQLAGCLVVRHDVPGPLTFVCADARLCAAAGLEGVAVLNPLSP